MHFLNYAIFATVFAWLVIAVESSRRVIAVVLIGAIAGTMLLSPPRAEAQGGLIAAIQAVLNVINGVIQTALTAINTARSAMNNLYQTVTWPVEVINQARDLVSQMIGQYRTVMRTTLNINIKSATLADPQALEVLIRDHRVNNFGNLTLAFGNTYRAIPLPTDAGPTDRAMSDMDDALVLDNLKCLKASDQGTDLELRAADNIENAASQAAPGSAPFLTASAVASSVRSQAVTQKMLAAELRQEAARIAHQNELRKHGAISATQLRNAVVNLLRHN